MLDVEKKSRMTVVTKVACRSYSALEFDGCPACVDAALDAVTQAGLYVLGRAAPSIVEPAPNPGSLDIDYRFNVRICDEVGEPIGQDELEAAQTISAVVEDDTWDDATTLPPDDADEDDLHPAGSMRLDDFQTMLDLVDLGPAGRGSVRGVIRGQLFGFERPIGQFEIEVLPGR